MVKIAEDGTVTEAAARKMLKDACKGRGAQSAFAKKAGVSQQYISNALKGERTLSDKLLKALGIKSVTMLRVVGAPKARPGKMLALAAVNAAAAAGLAVAAAKDIG